VKLTADITLESSDALLQRIDRLLDLVELYVNSHIPLRLKKGFVMFILPDSQPDVNFSIDAPQVEDAKGVIIPNEKLTFGVVSDNPASVAVTLNPDGLSGSIKVGVPGLANLNATVKDTASGALLGSFGAQFTITPGAASKIVGGDIRFAGITEAPAPPTP
jgi:hypothetical protein